MFADFRQRTHNTFTLPNYLPQNLPIMAIKLKVNLWEHKADKNGLCPIAISIRGKGAESYYQTEIKVHPDNWKDGKITKSVPNYDIKNNRIAALIKDTERKILNAELQEIKVTVGMVKEWLKPTEIKVDFLAYAQTIIDGKKEATKRRYGFELDKLRIYTKGKLRFSDITPKWLDAYYEYLRKDVAHNTAINAFKVIRHVFNESEYKPYPFDNWEYPQYQKPKGKYLTLAECEKLFGILDRKDVGANVKLVTAFFLMECFAGTRFSDWNKYHLETIVANEDMLLITTKTDTPVAVPIDLMPSLQRIMNYIKENKLKYTRDISYANNMLQDVIAPLAGIEKHMTTHLARHTFATTWLSRGLSKTSIAKMMGITDKQVDTYAHFSNDKIRNEIGRVGGF